MVDCVHHVPGRARFKLDTLRHDPELAERIRSEVGALPGVSAVEVNRHAASVIVHYCTERGEITCIMDHICIHCPKAAANRDRAPKLPAPSTVRPRIALSGLAPHVTSAMGTAVSKAVVNTLINRAVERGLTSVLTGFR